MTPDEMARERTLREVLRIAQEGAAMLEDAQTTRAAFCRRVDPYGVTCRVVPGTRAGEETDTLYYVVNYADKAGFALVAADERIADRLLVVTEQGQYAAGERTDNAGFDLYVDMLDRSLKDSLMIRDSTFRDPSMIEGKYKRDNYYSDWTSKGPYVTVKWGQGSVPYYNANYPYNKYCYSKKDELSPAGCVTVAIAQIMFYHKKPSRYKITFDGSKKEQEIPWSFFVPCIGGIGYSWEERVGGLITDELAKLFREIGKRASMTYTPDGSSATTFGARESFASFGYDQNPQRAYNFTDVQKELDAGRPLWMGGHCDGVDKNGNPIKEGHAWVVDGYKYRYHYIREYIEYIDGRREYYRNETTTDQYVHINWGYDGRNNGYYQNNVFDLAKAYEYDSDSVYENYLDGDYKYNLLIITGIWNDDEN